MSTNNNYSVGNQKSTIDRLDFKIDHSYTMTGTYVTVSTNIKISMLFTVLNQDGDIVTALTNSSIISPDHVIKVEAVKCFINCKSLPCMYDPILTEWKNYPNVAKYVNRICEGLVVNNIKDSTVISFKNRNEKLERGMKIYGILLINGFYIDHNSKKMRMDVELTPNPKIVGNNGK